MSADLSINQPPSSGAYSGNFYTIIGTGGYTMEQGFPTILLATQNPIIRYDVTNAVQVKFDVRTFNRKLGLVKDASNQYVVDTSFNYLLTRFPTDTLTISAAEFLAGMQAAQVLSVGTYSTIYSDFNTYVNTYFGYAGGFASLFASVSQFDYNGGVFDAAAFINIITGSAVDASGAYVNNLTGSITIYNINNLLKYAVDGNVFGNRDPSGGTTASDPTNPANYGVADGFLDGDLILIPSGTSITLKLSIQNDNFNPVNNVGPSNVSTLNQLSNFSQKYGSSYYTESTVATTSNITRTLTAPLLFILKNLS
jgi:hypothetical protein